MGVHRLTSWSHEKPQCDLLYEKRDLRDFSGKRFIVDAASFMFWILQDVMPRQDLHYLGDYGQDFVAVVRYF
ncbi:hypothetical protein Naga_100683g2 [Nannochloropsis gaditana]|uniref:Uncharacterized protein n=1 Tax=Nannochloropsis gaditana TaxID=72520 RepID=W7T0B4_9STRA|nr:hypothetical protein Naga_100683g2 [Nannochloropsis gaditana]